ncbi:hypothetical protein BGW36DRAFT_359253 [Talaromyces proteolyticus]|uniref:Uncharacterized protein n=1 Tax=Talaromyces proteolyticus TaxID=1131652 RepID=A0AAD4KPG3_9EURO|nr:uncharacterized protein BGW36DRAFT_359253 [Talaromyces proteolyticus]KAH8697462.1 hypothetical protein BGW36DRAFT_359253 [Talaromyces proteolyticus]
MQLKIAALTLASASAVLVAGDAIADFNIPPDSIMTVLETALPTSIAAELTNPAAISSWADALVSSIEAGNTPGWVASLPPSVKTYLYTAYATDATAAPTAAATGATTTTAATAAATHASTGGAPAVTGALAMGVAGAVGVLGLAIAL